MINIRDDSILASGALLGADFSLLGCLPPAPTTHRRSSPPPLLLSKKTKTSTAAAYLPETHSKQV